MSKEEVAFMFCTSKDTTKFLGHTLQNVRIGEELNPIKNANVIIRMPTFSFLQLFIVDVDLINCLNTSYFKNSPDYYNYYFMMRVVAKVLTSTQRTLPITTHEFHLKTNERNFLYDLKGSILTPSEMNLIEGDSLDPTLCEEILKDISSIPRDSDGDKIRALATYKVNREKIWKNYFS